MGSASARGRREIKEACPDKEAPTEVSWPVLLRKGTEGWWRQREQWMWSLGNAFGKLQYIRVIAPWHL